MSNLKYPKNRFLRLVAWIIATVVCVWVLSEVFGTIAVKQETALFFGDSITEGLGVNPNQRWSYLVAQAIGMREVNRGISATVLQNTYPVLPNNGRDRINIDILNRFPNKIYILYGLNDLRYNGAKFSVSNYENDLREILDILINQAHINPKNITIGSPPYIDPAHYTNAAYTPFNAGSTTKHLAYVDASYNAAKAYKCKWTNVYQAMIDNGGISLISADHIHPNIAGHSVIARAMLTATSTAKSPNSSFISQYGSDKTKILSTTTL